MQKKSRGGYSQGRGLPEGLRKMFERKTHSNNSSSQTPTGSESQQPNLEVFWTTPCDQDAKLDTSSSSNGTESVSSDTSRDIEIEGDCTVNFFVSIRNFGIYSKVERDLARAMAHMLHREFGDRSELYDELGREVVFNRSASAGSKDSIVIVEAPS